MFSLLSNLFTPASIAPKVLDALAIGTLAVLVYVKGYHSADVACAKNETQMFVQDIKDHGKIKQEVMGLGEPDVDQYLSNWMRD